MKNKLVGNISPTSQKSGWAYTPHSSVFLNVTNLSQFDGTSIYTKLFKNTNSPNFCAKLVTSYQNMGFIHLNLK